MYLLYHPQNHNVIKNVGKKRRKKNVRIEFLPASILNFFFVIFSINFFSNEKNTHTQSHHKIGDEERSKEVHLWSFFFRPLSLSPYIFYSCVFTFFCVDVVVDPLSFWFVCCLCWPHIHIYITIRITRAYGPFDTSIFVILTICVTNFVTCKQYYKIHNLNKMKHTKIGSIPKQKKKIKIRVFFLSQSHQDFRPPLSFCFVSSVNVLCLVFFCCCKLLNFLRETPMKAKTMRNLRDPMENPKIA